MADNFSLSGKVIIVTGGTGILGNSFVNGIVEAGARRAHGRTRGSADPNSGGLRQYRYAYTRWLVDRGGQRGIEWR